MQIPALHILQGKYKNRRIKMPEKIHGHNEVTSQKIKESVFQICLNLANSEENTIFIDCFCGSGQMGFEAVSRNYAGITFFDLSTERISAAKIWAETNLDADDRSSCRFEKKDSLRSIFSDVINNYQNWFQDRKNIKNIVFFADPPYELPYKNQNILNIYIKQFLDVEIPADINLILIFQTNKKNMIKSVLLNETLPEDIKVDFYKIYKYGNNRILVFKRFCKQDLND